MDLLQFNAIQRLAKMSCIELGIRMKSRGYQYLLCIRSNHAS